MKPTLRVLTAKEDGGDHDPSGCRATTTPEPLPQENCAPERKTVKIARPAAELRTCRGILTIAFRLDNESFGGSGVPSVGNVSLSLTTLFFPRASQEIYTAE